MSLGTGIVLFVIGAILAFAVHVQVAWIDLTVVGYILMIAGIVGIILGIVLLTHRRRTVTVDRTSSQTPGETTSRRTTDSDDPLL